MAMSSPIPSDIVPKLRSRSLAVGSGKGGVGKSTTALNVALLLARQGIRTGLVDLDPLSNVAAILDIPEARLAKVLQDPRLRSPFRQFILPYSHGLEVVFPHPGGRSDGGARKLALFRRFAAQLVERYDALIFDLPAGISADENLGFLPYVGALLLVTNAEPTSHVSAGGYLRSVFEVRPTMPVMVWHNRYRPAGDEGFDPRAVVDNYNRYVEGDLQIREEERAVIHDVAFVPPDPSLNLLQTELDPTVTIYSKIAETLGLVFDQLVRTSVREVPISKNSQDLIAYYLTQNRGFADPDTGVAEVDAFLAAVAKNGAPERLKKMWARLDRGGEFLVLSQGQAQALRDVVVGLRDDELASELVRVLGVLDDAVESAAATSRGFSQRTALDHHRIVRGAVPKVLALLATEFASPAGRLPVFARHAGATALFLIAADSELEDEETAVLLRRLVPLRTGENGRRRRDRYTQILRVLSRDERYHKLFYQVVRTVFPGISKRISALSRRFGLAALMFRSDDGTVNAPAYVKLTTHLIHDVVNAGLGVSISATYNAASQAIRAGVEEIVRQRGWSASRRGPVKTRKSPQG